MLLDAFMGFLAIVAVVQFLYCVVGGKDVSPVYLFPSILCLFGWGCGLIGLIKAIQRLPERFLRGCRSIRPYGKSSDANEFFKWKRE